MRAEFGEMVLWAPGMVEIIILLFMLLGIPAAFAAILFLKYMSGGSEKTCPYCAEKIKASAKICRYCQRDVIGV